MEKREMLKKIAEKLEILAVVVMFFVMLVTCGMYIDIRINSESSSLPTMPAGIKEVLLKTGTSQKTAYTDDMIEPIFIGFKDDGKQICATFDSEVRQSLESATSSYLLALFEGTAELINFEDEAEYYRFLEQTKNSEKFVLISYYSDIPASVFLPCLSSDVHIDNSTLDFFVKHIFVLSDENMNVYGLAFSSDKKVYKLVPGQSVPFDKITAYEYDVNDGFSYFTFASEHSVSAVFETSFVSNKYSLDTLVNVYGNTLGTKWINDCFEMFGMNENYVKSYSFKNGTEIIYVHDENELLVSDDGNVEFTVGTNGVYLGKILGYEAPEDGRYLFSDKIVAIKNIVNTVKNERDLIDCGIVGVDYDTDSMELSVYIKYFVNGIAVTEDGYDAVFRIVENNLVYAKFATYLCSASDEEYVFVNQKYMNNLLDSESIDIDSENVMFFAVLEQEENGKLYIPKNSAIAVEKGGSYYGK